MGAPDTDLKLIMCDNNEWSSYVNSFRVDAASNILIGTNPAYSVSDFLTFYPQFGTLIGGTYSGPVLGGLPVLTAFVTLATACLQQARWQDMWQLAMALFVAHYVTLYMQATSGVTTNSPASAIVGAGLTKEITVSKGIGQLSTSSQLITTGWEGWGQWLLTQFGIQLIQMASIVTAAPMWIY